MVKNVDKKSIAQDIMKVRSLPRKSEIKSERRDKIEAHKERVGAVGCISGKLFSHYAVRTCTEVSSYYVIPELQVLIPLCATAGDTFQVYAVNHGGGLSLMESVHMYPTISQVAYGALKGALGEWTILPVLVDVLVTKPVKVLSPMELEAIRDAKKKNNYVSKKKYVRELSIDW